MSTTLLSQLQVTASFIKSKINATAETAIILGSGLGNLAAQIKVDFEIQYTEIPHFPVSTVEGHKGRLILGTLNGVKVWVMEGRFHFYEGYTMKQVVFPVYVMKALGIDKLLISNISGSLNPNIKAGELIIINDHINLHAENPLRGKNFDELGPRFPDMSTPYDTELIHRACSIAENHEIPHHQGVYVGLQGPNLETPAEYRYLRLIGGDCVGMSTIPEVIAANHCGLRVFAISVITDEAFPAIRHKITINEIIKIAQETEPLMGKILRELV